MTPDLQMWTLFHTSIGRGPRPYFLFLSLFTCQPCHFMGVLQNIMGMWAPEFVGALFGRTVWTTLNAPRPYTLLARGAHRKLPATPLVVDKSPSSRRWTATLCVTAKCCKHSWTPSVINHLVTAKLHRQHSRRSTIRDKQGFTLTGRYTTGPPRAVPWWVTLHIRVLQTTTDDRRRQTPATVTGLPPLQYV